MNSFNIADLSPEDQQQFMDLYVWLEVERLLEERERLEKVERPDVQNDLEDK